MNCKKSESTSIYQTNIPIDSSIKELRKQLQFNSVAVFAIDMENEKTLSKIQKYIAKYWTDSCQPILIDSTKPFTWYHLEMSIWAASTHYVGFWADTDNEYTRSMRSCLIGYKIAVGNLLPNNKVFSTNRIKNIKHIVKSLSYRDIIIEAPRCLCFGCGPSLDTFLEEYRERRISHTQVHRCLIVAVDGACEPLVDAGITPHVVCTLDPHKKKFETCAHVPEGALFVANSDSCPEVFEVVSKNSHLLMMHGMHYPYVILDNVKNNTTNSFSMCVGHIAVGFSLLYCDSVHLIGHDLSDSDRQNHAKSINYDARVGGAPVTATAYNGEQVGTSEHFEMFARRMEKHVEPFDKKITNCNLRALKVDGILHETTQEYLKNTFESAAMNLRNFPDREIAVGVKLSKIINSTLRQLELGEEALDPDTVGLVNGLTMERLFCNEEFWRRIGRDKKKNAEKAYQEYTRLEDERIENGMKLLKKLLLEVKNG